jgi:hypothetical protein
MKNKLDSNSGLQKEHKMTKLHKNLSGKILRARVLFGLTAALALLIALQGIFNPQLTAFAATAPTLGTAGNFAVLAGSAVTNTGPSVINGGSLGVSPGSAVTGFPPGIVTAPGTIHTADAVAANAQSAVTMAYNDLAGQPCTADLTGQDLGGMNLTSGVYCFPNTSAQLTGALVLNAAGNPNAVFIFKIGSTLTTASASSVVATGNLNPCNVFWQVGSSATLGSGTSFAGNILALTSITLVTNASIVGRALARNGAVTLDTNNISSLACATSTTPTTTPTPTAATTTTAPVSTSQIQGWVLVDGKPGVGLVVKLEGPSNATVTIDAGGFFYFNNLPAGTYKLSLVYDHSKYKAGTPDTLIIKTDGVNSYRNNAFGLTTIQATTVAPTTAAPTPSPIVTPAPTGTPVPVPEATPVLIATPTPGLPTTPTPRVGLPPLPPTGPNDAPAETFPETGFTLSGALLGFWHLNGALPIFGFPIDSEREANGLVFQWFERNRLELHPENIAPYNILLGRLGAEVLAKNGIDWTTQPKVSSAPQDCLYFQVTGHSLCGAFLAYWQTYGLVFESSNAKTFAESLALFGMPLSEPSLETNSSGDKVLTQWFERARFEFHPDLPGQYKVLLGRLGSELNLQLPSRSNRL